MAISKKFQIREGVGFHLRVDATNILNHPKPIGSVGGFFGSTESPILNLNSSTPFGQLGGKRGEERQPDMLV